MSPADSPDYRDLYREAADRVCREAPPVSEAARRLLIDLIARGKKKRKAA